MNQAQVRTRSWHQQVARFMGFGQSKFKHRQLFGSESVVSPAGNQLYTGPGARTTDETTTDTLVWALWRQREPKTNPNDDLPEGRTREIRFSGQMPMYDDAGNLINIADEDWLESPVTAMRWKIQNPQISPEEGFVIFEMEVMR